MSNFDRGRNMEQLIKLLIELELQELGLNSDILIQAIESTTDEA